MPSKTLLYKIIKHASFACSSYFLSQKPWQNLTLWFFLSEKEEEEASCSFDTCNCTLCPSNRWCTGYLIRKQYQADTIHICGKQKGKNVCQVGRSQIARIKQEKLFLIFCEHMAGERCEMEGLRVFAGMLKWNLSTESGPLPFGSVRESGWCVQQFPVKFLILAWKNISGNDASLQQNLAGEAKVRTLAGLSHWCEVFCSELWEPGLVVAWMCARSFYILLYSLLFAFPTTEIAISFQFYLVWLEMSHTCVCNLREYFFILEESRELASDSPDSMELHGMAEVTQLFRMEVDLG